MIAEGFGVLDLPLCGMIRRDPALAVASRHLGLVQAREDGALADRIDAVAAILARDCNLDPIRAAAHATFPAAPAQPRLRPPCPRIALAADAPFPFFYPPLSSLFHAAGSAIPTLAPLAAHPPP